MDDEIAVVEQHPAGIVEALDATRCAASLRLDEPLDLLGDRANLAGVASTRDHEVIRDPEQISDIEHHRRVDRLRRRRRRPRRGRDRGVKATRKPFCRLGRASRLGRHGHGRTPTAARTGSVPWRLISPQGTGRVRGSHGWQAWERGSLKVAPSQPDRAALYWISRAQAPRRCARPSPRAGSPEPLGAIVVPGRFTTTRTTFERTSSIRSQLSSPAAASAPTIRCSSAPGQRASSSATVSAV